MSDDDDNDDLISYMMKIRDKSDCDHDNDCSGCLSKKIL